MYTENQETLNNVLKCFSDSASRYYKSYGFEAGYLESVIIHLLPKLSKKNQKELIESMLKSAQEIEQKLVEKILKGAI